MTLQVAGTRRGNPRFVLAFLFAWIPALEAAQASSHGRRKEATREKTCMKKRRSNKWKKPSTTQRPAAPLFLI